MYIVFVLLGLLSIFIMIGFLYRISITAGRTTKWREEGQAGFDILFGLDYL